MASNPETLVTVFGGSGFLGRNVVRALAKRDYRIRVAVRRPELAGHLQPLGRVGQIHAVQANLRYPASVEAAMRDSPRRDQPGRHPDRERRADASTPCRPRAPSTIAGAARRRRADGACVRDRRRREFAVALRPHQGGRRAGGAGGACPAATILRPSVVFGPEDQFTNRFAALARMSPVLPLIGGGVTRMQPVYVGDVATAVADAVDGKTQARRGLRTRRAGSADHARDHGNHSRHHRAQAHAGVAAVRAGAAARRCSCNSRRAR